tara:strand:- start:1277 stop:3643 length:2367 start_codon:yes stop_codon:yes gene_type:complete
MGGFAEGVRQAEADTRLDERHEQQMELGRQQLEFAELKAEELATQQETDRLLRQTKLDDLQGKIQAGKDVFGDPTLGLDRKPLDEVTLLVQHREGILAQGGPTAGIDRALALKLDELDAVVTQAKLKQNRNSDIRYITEMAGRGGVALDDEYVASLEEMTPAQLDRLQENWQRMEQAQQSVGSLRTALLEEVNGWNATTTAGRQARDAFKLAMDSPIPSQYTNKLTGQTMRIDTPQEVEQYYRALFHEKLIATLPSEIQELIGEPLDIEEDSPEAEVMPAYEGMRKRMTGVFSQHRAQQAQAQAQAAGVGVPGTPVADADDPVAAALEIGEGGSQQPQAEEGAPQVGTESHQAWQLSQMTGQDIARQVDAEAQAAAEKGEAWTYEQRRDRLREVREEVKWAKAAEASAHGTWLARGLKDAYGTIGEYTDYSMPPETRMVMVESLPGMVDRAKTALEDVPEGADAALVRGLKDWVKEMGKWDKERLGSHNAVASARWLRKLMNRIAQADVDEGGPVMQWAEQIAWGDEPQADAAMAPGPMPSTEFMGGVGLGPRLGGLGMGAGYQHQDLEGRMIADDLEGAEVVEGVVGPAAQQRAGRADFAASNFGMGGVEDVGEVRGGRERTRIASPLTAARRRPQSMRTREEHRAAVADLARQAQELEQQETDKKRRAELGRARKDLLQEEQRLEQALDAFESRREQMEQQIAEVGVGEGQGSLREQRSALPPNDYERLSLLVSKQASGATLRPVETQALKRLLAGVGSEQAWDLYRELAAAGHEYPELLKIAQDD